MFRRKTPTHPFRIDIPEKSWEQRIQSIRRTFGGSDQYRDRRGNTITSVEREILLRNDQYAVVERTVVEAGRWTIHTYWDGLGADPFHLLVFYQSGSINLETGPSAVRARSEEEAAEKRDHLVNLIVALEDTKPGKVVDEVSRVLLSDVSLYSHLF